MFQWSITQNANPPVQTKESLVLHEMPATRRMGERGTRGRNTATKMIFVVQIGQATVAVARAKNQ